MSTIAMERGIYISLRLGIRDWGLGNATKAQRQKVKN